MCRKCLPPALQSAPLSWSLLVRVFEMTKMAKVCYVLIDDVFAGREGGGGAFGLFIADLGDPLDFPGFNQKGIIPRRLVRDLSAQSRLVPIVQPSDRPRGTAAVHICCAGPLGLHEIIRYRT